MRQMLRGYVALAAGLAEMARQRLVEASRTLTEDNDVDLDRLVAATEPVLRQVQDTAAWLLARSRANREILTQLVREEVERSATALGLVRVEEIDDLEDRVDELERSIAQLRAGPGGSTPAEPAAKPGAKKAVAKPGAKKAVAKPGAKKAVAKPGAKKAVAKPGANKAVAKPGAEGAAGGEPGAEPTAAQPGAEPTAAKKGTAAEEAATRPTTERPS